MLLLFCHMATTSEPKVIQFYGRHTPYYEFSNFYPCYVQVDGLEWPSSEAYYQAEKFSLPHGAELREKIRKARNATTAKQLAYTLPCDPNWDTRKVAVMRKVLRCKFTQHPRLRELLLGTGNSTLVEHTKNDSFWGDGGREGNGQNMLGRLLMELRTELSSQ
jgi:N-glycosidase YbiA